MNTQKSYGCQRETLIIYCETKSITFNTFFKLGYKCRESGLLTRTNTLTFLQAGHDFCIGIINNLYATRCYTRSARCWTCRTLCNLFTAIKVGIKEKLLPLWRTITALWYLCTLPLLCHHNINTQRYHKCRCKYLHFMYTVLFCRRWWGDVMMEICGVFCILNIGQQHINVA